jgi:hypothetical protein
MAPRAWPGQRSAVCKRGTAAGCRGMPGERRQGTRTAVRSVEDQQLQGAKGAPDRVVVSPRKSPSDGLNWAGAPLRCTCCPPTVSPLVKVRSPPSDSHSVGPLERPSPCGCCTDLRTLPRRRGNRGHIRLRSGCPPAGRARRLPGHRSSRREATGRRPGVTRSNPERRRATQGDAGRRRATQGDAGQGGCRTGLAVSLGVG